MSTIVPTQYGVAQYNVNGYNLTAVAVNGSVTLFDGLLTNDALTESIGSGLQDLIRINEWIYCYIIPGTNPWTTPTGSSTTWTTPPPSTTRQIWENADAPNQIP